MNAAQRRRARRQEQRAITGTPPAMRMEALSPEREHVLEVRAAWPHVQRKQERLAIAVGVSVGAMLVGGILAALAVLL